MELTRINLGLLSLLLYVTCCFCDRCGKIDVQLQLQLLTASHTLLPFAAEARGSERLDVSSQSDPSSFPPYCVYPPFTPSPPSTTPIQSPPPPPPPPSSIYNPPPEVVAGPPFYVPSPPFYVPGPPLFLPPVVYPPPRAPPPPAAGGTLPGLWCVAKPTVPDPIIQEAMDYACNSGADCDSIQPDGGCFQPDTLLAHASFAFNSYWQRTKVAGGTCDFGGTALLITVDPSESMTELILFKSRVDGDLKPELIVCPLLCRLRWLSFQHDVKQDIRAFSMVFPCQSRAAVAGRSSVDAMFAVKFWP
ncbi:hypothetical protein BHM03_00004698 [Ensete ventricosum]|nr:hypothetical protein BHM03_00004698 [Ensete ventricosum]